jgi:putative ABC transport system substrate-binding protein
LVAAFSKGLKENGYIDGKNVTVTRERPASRAAQFATFTAREKIPAAYAVSELVVAGGLTSYGTDFADLYHQVGVYSGSILKGAKTTDLPVLQSSKFEFVINLQTARASALKCRPEF